MITTYAALVLPDNVDDIIETVARKGLNVDYLKDEINDALEYDESLRYAILSLNQETKQATFTTISAEDFVKNWHFSYGFTHGRHFKEVRLDNSTAR